MQDYVNHANENGEWTEPTWLRKFRSKQGRRVKTETSDTIPSRDERRRRREAERRRVKAERRRRREEKGVKDFA